MQLGVENRSNDLQDGEVPLLKENCNAHVDDGEPNVDYVEHVCETVINCEQNYAN